MGVVSDGPVQDPDTLDALKRLLKGDTGHVFVAETKCGFSFVVTGHGPDEGFECPICRDFLHGFGGPEDLK